MSDEDETTTPAGDEDESTTPAGDESTPADEDESTTPAGDEDDDAGDLEGDTFPRSYVERIRNKSAGYRTRATEAEARAGDLERALFTERVRALDLLADPGDLEFRADLLDDAAALEQAARDLLARKPHYGRRGTVSDSGLRDTPDGEEFGLLDIMRAG